VASLPGEGDPRAWGKVARGIFSDVSEGKLQPGEQLPPSPVVAAAYGVSTGVVRRAFQGLAEAGVIRQVSGRGWCVRGDLGMFPRPCPRI
jgi:DNA-binding GntR family transcriptional regulator